MSMSFELIYRILGIQAIDSRLDAKRIQLLVAGSSQTQDYQAYDNALIPVIAAGFFAAHGNVYPPGFDMSITPFQAGLGSFINLNKPDFIGKAALLDADPQPQPCGLKCASTTPDSQAEIMHNGICAGRVTVSEWSPFLD